MFMCFRLNVDYAVEDQFYFWVDYFIIIYENENEVMLSFLRRVTLSGWKWRSVTLGWNGPQFPMVYLPILTSHTDRTGFALDIYFCDRIHKLCNICSFLSSSRLVVLKTPMDYFPHPKPPSPPPNPPRCPPNSPPPKPPKGPPAP